MRVDWFVESMECEIAVEGVLAEVQLRNSRFDLEMNCWIIGGEHFLT
jgi:hypothetical protein